MPIGACAVDKAEQKWKASQEIVHAWGACHAKLEVSLESERTRKRWMRV